MSAPTPSLGDTATCRTCSKPIELVAITDGLGLPGSRWSDNHRSDPLVCFSAISYRHSPDATAGAR